MAEDRYQRTRYNPTNQSRVFSEEPERARPSSRNRVEEKWKSTVFEGPLIEPAKRKKLGQADVRGDDLFGTHQVDFGNKSNAMPILGT